MNPLYQSFRKERENQNGPPQNLNAMLQNVAQQIAPSGLSAEQIVRQMMRNNQLSQAQFEQAARIADMWTGGRR